MLSCQSRYRCTFVGGPTASTNDDTVWCAVVFGWSRNSSEDSRMSPSYSSRTWCRTSRYIASGPEVELLDRLVRARDLAERVIDERHRVAERALVVVPQARGQ